MRVVVKNMPKLKLSDLLRRRKMTLRAMLDEFGITTYGGLLVRCDRMGCAFPTEAEFKIAYPDKPVNSPTEGVVVVEAPPVIDDITGHKIDPEAPVVPEVKVITEPLGQFLPRAFSVTNVAPSEEPIEPSRKKPRKKKETSEDGKSGRD